VLQENIWVYKKEQSSFCTTRASSCLYYFLERYTRKAKLSGAPKALLLSVSYSETVNWKMLPVSHTANREVIWRLFHGIAINQKHVRILFWFNYKNLSEKAH
jgi:hypothetical protein